MMKPHYEMFARYNRWANERVYASAARLPESDYKADRGAFFGSLHGTLNHILVADRIWLRRLTGEGDMPGRLNALLYDDLAGLAAARMKEDARLGTYVSALGEDDFAGTVTFRSTQGVESTQPRGAVLAHVFNHQTHHRGQAHALLTGLGQEGPVLDLMAFLRETT